MGKHVPKTDTDRDELIGLLYEALIAAQDSILNLMPENANFLDVNNLTSIIDNISRRMEYQDSESPAMLPSARKDTQP